MSLTEKQAADLEHALAEVESGNAPVFVPKNIKNIPFIEDLPEELINELRATDDYQTPQYKLYLAWRRFAAIRLSAQGFTYEEIGAQLGISTGTVSADLRNIRKKYEGMARRDWALLVEERIMSIDNDISELRRMLPLIHDMDIDKKLRVYDRIANAEARRDKILGLDKAAASQHVEKTAMVVKLSFDQTESGFVTDDDEPPIIDVAAIE